MEKASSKSWSGQLNLIWNILFRYVEICTWWEHFRNPSKLYPNGVAYTLWIEPLEPQLGGGAGQGRNFGGNVIRAWITCHPSLRLCPPSLAPEFGDCITRAWRLCHPSLEAVLPELGSGVSRAWMLCHPSLSRIASTQSLWCLLLGQKHLQSSLLSN